MAKTWRLDEYIPCLDLYLRRGTLNESDREVQDVAKLIGRTPASVAFRLGNLCLRAELPQSQPYPSLCREASGGKASG